MTLCLLFPLRCFVFVDQRILKDGLFKIFQRNRDQHEK